MNWNRERQEWEGTYTCQRPVAVARGPCTVVRYHCTGYRLIEVGTPDRSLTKFEPNYKVEEVGPVHGPATLLCSAYSAGGPPFDCAVHWLEGRKIVPLQERRIKREGRRQLKKQP